ncbi:hypothetical protein [Halofilum ochraceum]|uniref:hypothetical protein n=1 Tax=Halofilum ochraceum TaxID=1611323 RepID=UPI0008D994BD|nr:hypothetical protein [Halofilum ochraceum]
MFDPIDRPPAEYRLSRVLSDELGQSQLSSLRSVIIAAVENLQRYDRERYAHKYQDGPVPRLALLTEAHESVAEAGRMIRSMRAGDDDHALERRHGINIATVIDELWQASNAIGRWIEHERTRGVTDE